MAKQVKIGIDLGGTRVKMALVDSRGKISLKREVNTPNSANRKDIIDLIVINVLDLINLSNIGKRYILGVGIGVPGPVDFEKGMIHFLPNIKGWKNVLLRDILKQKLDLKVALDNDVNAMTLAEFRFGAGRGACNIVCLTLGTGVGGGIIINKQIYRGSSMCAGEVGHIPINEIGPKCNCGGKACLERYIGNKYILERSRRVFGKEMTLERLTSRAKEGNKKAKAIWEDVGRKLGVALTGVVNLLNPEVIIVGGGVSKAGKLILDPLRNEIKLRAMPNQAKCVKVVSAKLGNDAGIIGASLLV